MLTQLQRKLKLYMLVPEEDISKELPKLEEC
jgi:hypothetical protein